MFAYEFCLMDSLWAEHGLTQPSEKCMFLRCKLSTKNCATIITLWGQVSALSSCQTAGKNLCCFTEHQESSVDSCELIYYTYSPLIMKREWGKHPVPHSWPIHSRQAPVSLRKTFGKETWSLLWLHHMLEGLHWICSSCVWSQGCWIHLI